MSPFPRIGKKFVRNSDEAHIAPLSEEQAAEEQKIKDQLEQRYRDEEAAAQRNLAGVKTAKALRFSDADNRRQGRHRGDAGQGRGGHLEADGAGQGDPGAARAPLAPRSFPLGAPTVANESPTAGRRRARESTRLTARGLRSLPPEGTRRGCIAAPGPRSEARKRGLVDLRHPQKLRVLTRRRNRFGADLNKPKPLNLKTRPSHGRPYWRSS